MTVVLPRVPDRVLLADLCRETAARERVQPQLVEKDFYLTRLLWVLGQSFGDALLLKGGTLLSKVDLGFFRMSEDADLVLPGLPSRQRLPNVRRMHRIRDALGEIGRGETGFEPADALRDELSRAVAVRRIRRAPGDEPAIGVPRASSQRRTGDRRVERLMTVTSPAPVGFIGLGARNSGWGGRVASSRALRFLPAVPGSHHARAGRPIWVARLWRYSSLSCGTGGRGSSPPGSLGTFAAREGVEPDDQVTPPIE